MDGSGDPGMPVNGDSQPGPSNQDLPQGPVLNLLGSVHTDAVPAVAMSVAGIAAFSCELFTKVVARALPFQFTTEFETKPVPLTVRVKSAVPSGLLVGLILVVVGAGLPVVIVTEGWEPLMARLVPAKAKSSLAAVVQV